MKMVVYKVQVQSRGAELEDWSIDEDEYIYIILCQDVYTEFLGTTFMEREEEVRMITCIRGGEHKVKLVNDRLVIRMFNLNTNPNNHINIYVDMQVVAFVPECGEHNERLYISSDEDSMSLRNDGVDVNDNIEESVRIRDVGVCNTSLIERIYKVILTNIL